MKRSLIDPLAHGVVSASAKCTLTLQEKMLVRSLKMSRRVKVLEISDPLDGEAGLWRARALDVKCVENMRTTACLDRKNSS